MIRLDLLRALNPQPGYPRSPLDVSLNNVRYDLALPPTAADGLHAFLSESRPFTQLRDYATPMALAALLSPDNTAVFEPGFAVFARAESQLDVRDDKLAMGSVIQQAVVNAQGASEIFIHAVNEENFAPEVGAWIMNHFRFFHLSGGFELARCWYYFTADEQAEVSLSTIGSSVTQEPKPVAETADALAIFRELLVQAESASAPVHHGHT